MYQKGNILPAVLLAAATVFSSYAGGLDLQSRVLLKRNAVQSALRKAGFQKGSLGSPNESGNLLAENVMALVALEDGSVASELEAAGMTVMTVRGDIALVSLPVDSVESWSCLPGIRKMSLQREMKPMTDLARKEAGIDDIHKGLGLQDIPYTGKGVIAGIVDEGMDPNNISFIGSDGKNRIKYLTYFDGTADKYGYPHCEYYGEGLYDRDEAGNVFAYPGVENFVTDNTSAYHGTHTMNVLAGGYTGNPYYGVATGADIAASCGNLADVCIAMGVSGILDYAAYRGQFGDAPSVVSLSLGATMGAHDPDGLMNRFLEECGKESIIVVAAGNEGDLKIALDKDMEGEDSSLATLIYPYYYRYDASKPEDRFNTYIRQGAVMVFSDDETPFEIKAFIMTGEPGNYRKRAVYDLTGEEGSYFLSDSFYADYVGGSVNATVGRYFDGYIGGGSMYDEDLGRYYGVFDYYLFSKPEFGINPDGSEAAIVGFEITGSDGQRIECYCDGANTWMADYGLEDYTDGKLDGTISDMAVGRNVLVVGAYTLRNSWKGLDGEEYGFDVNEDFGIDDIGRYSAFGTLADGRTLPHICAPGSAVISAVSRPFVEMNFKGDEAAIAANFQAKATMGGKDYYWKAETGTSMSTPLVAGAIALWLEADPSLTFDDVLDIISRTAVRDEYVERGNPVQWGAGKLDALAGLKEVISRRSDGIKGVSLDGHNDRLILTKISPTEFDIFVGEAACLDVRVYSTAGRLVATSTHEGSGTTLDLSALGKGVYVLTVNGHSAKIAI